MSWFGNALSSLASAVGIAGSNAADAPKDEAEDAAPLTAEEIRARRVAKLKALQAESAATAALASPPPKSPPPVPSTAAAASSSSAMSLPTSSPASLATPQKPLTSAANTPTAPTAPSAPPSVVKPLSSSSPAAVLPPPVDRPAEAQAVASTAGAAPASASIAQPPASVPPTTLPPAAIQPTVAEGAGAGSASTAAVTKPVISTAATGTSAPAAAVPTPVSTPLRQVAAPTPSATAATPAAAATPAPAAASLSLSQETSLLCRVTGFPASFCNAFAVYSVLREGADAVGLRAAAVVAAAEAEEAAAPSASSSSASSAASSAISQVLTVESLANAVDMKLEFGRVLQADGSPPSLTSPAAHLHGLQWLVFVWNAAEEASRSSAAGRTPEGAAVLRSVQKTAVDYICTLYSEAGLYPSAPRVLSRWQPLALARGDAPNGFSPESCAAYENAVLASLRLSSGCIPSGNPQVRSSGVPADVFSASSHSWLNLPPRLAGTHEPEQRRMHEAAWTLIAAGLGVVSPQDEVRPHVPGATLIRVGRVPPVAADAAGLSVSSAAGAGRGAGAGEVEIEGETPFYSEALLQPSQSMLAGLAIALEEAEANALSSGERDEETLPLLTRATLAGVGPLIAEHGPRDLTDSSRLPLVRAAGTIAAIKPLARAVVNGPLLLSGPPKVRAMLSGTPVRNTGLCLQFGTLLGSLLAPSALPLGLSGDSFEPSPVLAAHFDRVRRRSPGDVIAATASLREASSAVWESGARIMRALLESDAPAAATAAAGAASSVASTPGGPGSASTTSAAASAATWRPCREAVLEWMRIALAINAPRTRDFADRMTSVHLSSDGFLVNLGAALARLAEPIWEGTTPLALAGTAAPASASVGASSPSLAALQPWANDRTAKLELQFLLSGSAATQTGIAAASGGAGSGLSASSSSSSTSAASSAAGAAREALVSAPLEGSAALPHQPHAPATPLAAGHPDAAFKPPTRLFFYAVRAMQLGLARVLRGVRREQQMLGHLNHLARTQGGGDDGDDASDAGRRFGVVLSNKAACDVVRLHPDLLASAGRVCALTCEVVTRALFGFYDDGGIARLTSASAGSSAAASASSGTACILTSGAIDWSRLEACARHSAGARALPESLLSSVLDVLKHAASARDVFGRLCGAAAQLGDKEATSILHCLLVLLALPQGAGFAPSPHLRAAISDVLYELFVPVDAQPRGEEDGVAAARRRAQDAAADSGTALRHLLEHPTPFVRDNLVPALLVAYGAVEATGHFDKIDHRRRITTMLNYLWTLPEHRAAFHTIATLGVIEAGSGTDAAAPASAGTGAAGTATASASPSTSASARAGEFAAFANGLIGHSTTLLTDALAGLAKIKAIQVAMRDAAAWSALPAEARADKERSLSETTDMVASSFLLANETTALLSVLVEDAGVRARLMSEELVGRLADMLVHVLVTLAGPKGVTLKVDDPGRYNFKPVDMLRVIVTALLRLAAQPRFVAAVANSGMYKPATWDKVSAVIKRIRVLPDEVPASPSVGAAGGSLSATGSAAAATVSASGAAAPVAHTARLLTFSDWERFHSAVAEAVAEANEAAAIYADPPDEFLDPLLCDLMDDPVTTPHGHTFSRNCIMQQLLHKAEDPLNRQPLRVEDLKPADELRARIAAWKAERRAAYVAAKAAERAAAAAAAGGAGAGAGGAEDAEGEVDT